MPASEARIIRVSEQGRPVKPEQVAPFENAGCGSCHGRGQKWNGKLCECAMRRFLKAHHDHVSMGTDPERPGERTLLWARSVEI